MINETDKQFLILNHAQFTRRTFTEMFGCTENDIDQVLFKERISCKKDVRGPYVYDRPERPDNEEIPDHRKDFQWVTPDLSVYFSREVVTVKED